MRSNVKSSISVRRMEQRGKHCPPFILGARKIMLWVEGIEKGISHDLMDKLPAAALEKLIKVW